MKKVTITLALVTLILTGCKSQKTALDQHHAEISWNAFCDARGYDRNDNTYPALNEYLDTWCGSAEEEKAYLDAGIKPY